MRLWVVRFNWYIHSHKLIEIKQASNHSEKMSFKSLSILEDALTIIRQVGKSD